MQQDVGAGDTGAGTEEDAEEKRATSRRCMTTVYRAGVMQGSRRYFPCPGPLWAGHL